MAGEVASGLEKTGLPDTGRFAENHGVALRKYWGKKHCIRKSNMLLYAQLNSKDDDEEKYMLSDSQREDG